MRYQIAAIVIAFLSGLSVGALALGQKGDLPPLLAPPAPAPQESAAAFSIAPGGIKKSSTPMAKRNAETPAVAAAAALEPESIQPGPVSESPEYRLLSGRWADQERLLSRLEKRVRDLEQQLALLESARSSARQEESETQAESLPVNTPEDRRYALIAAGVQPTAAEEIVRWQSELDLDRLELQDQALREKWYQSDRYFEELTAVNASRVDLRAEIGEQAYDEYLYLIGEPNRVKVTSVLQGSAAEQSGLLPGDVIEGYDAGRIYGYSALRDATAEGNKGERVSVLIRRGDSLIETFIPRGPMGVKLEAHSAAPGSRLTRDRLLNETGK